MQHNRLISRAVDAGFRHQETGGDRDNQGRNLGDQAVADSQQHVGLGGFPGIHLMLENADHDAADDIDHGDDDTGHGIAAHEFRGTVHGAEEARFLLDFLAADLGLFLIDQAGGEIGIDGHLLAGHRIEGEARRHFGDTARTLGDNDEIDQHQNGEEDRPDDEITLGHQHAEGVDDRAGRFRSVLTMGQDDAHRGDVERQPEERGHQQHGRERAEFQRLLDEEAGHQDQDGRGDGKRQQDIEHPARHGHDQDHDDRDHADGHDDLAALQPAADFTEFERNRDSRRDSHAVLRGTIGPVSGLGKNYPIRGEQVVNLY